MNGDLLINLAFLGIGILIGLNLASEKDKKEQNNDKPKQ
jgi:hypothetical protein